MSVLPMLQAALATALTDHAPLAGALTAIFDAPPVRAARPFAVIDETIVSDWGTKDMAGVEGRIAILLYDGGERPVRLRTLAGAVDAALDAMPRALGAPSSAEWRIVSLVPVRSRILREGEGRWTAMAEYRVRMLRSN